MKKPIIAIIGGSQEGTFKKIAQKHGYDVLFHSGKKRNGDSKKAFGPMVKKADCVVVNLGACGHVTMEVVKDLCKATKTKFAFQEGFGASGAITAGIKAMELSLVS